MLNLEGAEEFLGKVADHFFDEVGHDLEVAKGLVGFEHGELGIMAAGDAFVAEVAVEFEDLGEAADEEALEVKLGCDPHGERHIESVMMGLEGTRGGSSGDVVKHGSFDFEVAAFMKEVADLGDDVGADDEEVGAFLVRHQVEVALAVFGLAVREAVPLVGHGAEGLGEDGELVDLDGGFAFAGGEGLAFEADPVAQVEALVGFPVGFRDAFFVEVNLNTAVGIAEGGEDGLAHVADGEEAAGDFDRAVVAEVGAEFARVGIGFESSAVGGEAQILEFREFLAPHGDEFLGGGLGLGGR